MSEASNPVPFDLERFAELVGEAPETLPTSVRDLLDDYELEYRVLDQAEREACFLQVLRQLESENLTVSGAHRLGDWERGWSENLERFHASGGQPEALVPGYHHAAQIDRCQGQYICSENPYFQVRFYDAFRHYLFHKYVADCAQVYEFGCGTGYNLLILASLFPEKTLKGFDWAEASVDLVNEIAATQQLKLSGQRFDMFHPDPDVNIGRDTAVMTFNSLEQLGTGHRAFIDFLRGQQPRLCIHAEPLLELYDPEQFFDALAIRYHRARGYLEGMVSYLQELAAVGEIEILKLQRIALGNQFHEGYSLCIWRPSRSGAQAGAEE